MFRCEGSLGVWYNCTYKSCRVGKSCAKLINELAAWEYVDWVEIDSKKYNNECELVRLFIEYKTDAERDKFVSQVRNYGENLKYPLED
jgi:hypothetical protein